ncbi:efflux RND transporter periplasmic adaptor subunit [Geoalkalibacter sp.]|uniref:efflux RND transporter periplasmic adaptor subunit n=1 Tax=Geoalkalibacter sp. TaxID=3041440 RepID=UPI00272E6381|nr:efflux RND transporter periplasmic adaptor subunit [Geoalkalibacter sp.]
MPLLALLILFLCLLSVPVAAQPNANSGPPPALVVTARVEAGQPRFAVQLVGTAEARYSAAVAAEVEGLVETLFARRGQKVAKGEVLARLRTHRHELMLEEARFALGEVEARIAKAESDLRRAQDLHTQKFISEEELQGRQTELDSLRQSAQRHRASIKILEDRLARMTIRAPFAGTVARENSEVGQWLREGDPLLELDDLSVIHVMVPVPENQLALIRVGGPAEVSFDALAGRAFGGRISAIVPRADLAARTFPVQIEIANPSGEILAGMLARVRFPREFDAPALLVPKDAFIPRPEGGGQVVRILDDQAQILEVRVLGAADTAFVVEPLDGDLAAGDEVVIRGNERLRPGQQIRRAGASAENGAP